MYNLICSPKSQVKAWPYLQIDCFYSWIASESGIKSKNVTIAKSIYDQLGCHYKTIPLIYEVNFISRHNFTHI